MRKLIKNETKDNIYVPFCAKRRKEGMTDFEQDSTLSEPFTRKDVLARNVSWRNYAEAGLISADELNLLQEFDGKKDRDSQLDLINSVCLITLHTPLT